MLDHAAASPLPPVPRNTGHPLSLANLDRITDFQLWELEDVKQAVHTSTAFYGRSAGTAVAHSDVEPWLEGLLAHVRRTTPSKIDFRVTYQPDDASEPYIFRGHRVPNTVGHPLLCLRRHPTRVPEIENLKLPRYWADVLMHTSYRKGGLIVLAAETGQGKSTTIAASVVSRLKRYGGFGMTIEDPAELPLHGTHGDGICIQTEILEDDGKAGFAKGLKSALRSFPTLPEGGAICVVGEVRDSETAAMLLSAALNGFLIFTTVHANNIKSACQRLVAYAQESIGEVLARDMLAAGLRCAIHQQLEYDPDEADQWSRGRLGGSILLSPDGASGAASVIREGKFEQLNDAIDQQKNLFANRDMRNIDQILARLSQP